MNCAIRRPRRLGGRCDISESMAAAQKHHSLVDEITTTKFVISTAAHQITFRSGPTPPKRIPALGVATHRTTASSAAVLQVPAAR